MIYTRDIVFLSLTFHKREGKKVLNVRCVSRAKRRISLIELSALSNGLNTTHGHSIRRTRRANNEPLLVRGIIGAVQLTTEIYVYKFGQYTENFIYTPSREVAER